MKGSRVQRWWKGLALALVLSLSLGTFVAQKASAQEGTVASTHTSLAGYVHVIETDAGHLTFEFTLPPLQLEKVEVDGRPYVSIRAEGLESTTEAGRPILPVAAFWLGLPPEGEVDIEVVDLEAHTVPLCAPVLPAPTLRPPEPLPEGLPASEGFQTQVLPDAALYGSDSAFPPALARLEAQGWVRSQRIGLLRLYPVQLNASRNELTVHEHIRVHLRFPPSQTTQEYEETAPFEALFRAVLLNADQARRWRVPRAAPAQAGLAAQLPVDARLLQILVDHDGLYRIDSQQLADLGFPIASLDPRQLHLLVDGAEVALWIPGEEDGILQPDESIYFFGVGSRSRYSRANVYWLTSDASPGLRMPLVLTQPGSTPPAPQLVATLRLEQNHFYVSQLADLPGADPWFWTYLYTPSAPQRTFDLVLDHVAASAGPATLRLSLRSTLVTGLNPDHHVRVFLDDALLGDGWWNDSEPVLLEFFVPHDLLQDGNHALRLVAPGDTGYAYDLFYVDWIEIRYARSNLVGGDRADFSLPEGGPWTVLLEPFVEEAVVALAIKDPRSPVLLAGQTEPIPEGFRFRFESIPGNAGRYLVLSLDQAESPAAMSLRAAPRLLQPSGADYLVIAPAAFFDAIRPLVEAYAASGLRTAIVDIQEIYDTFRYGRPDPEAIRAFLAYAYAHWTPPAPTYVLLVGDGHYDFRDDLGYGQPNWIPPYLAYVDPWMGETMADNRYVSIVGEDPLADMLLGRLPVSTPEEAAAVVQKVLSLRNGSDPQPWHSRVLFIADNPDGAGNFPALSDHLANAHLPPAYSADKVYLGVNYPYQNPALAARAAILQAIDEGRLVANYIGHAGVSALAAEQMLRTADVTTLSNAPRFPLLLVWACYAGRFGEPDPANTAITEAAVRNAAGGVVAAWGSTGSGLFWTHQHMNEGVFDALFQDGIAEIGAAMLAGNLRLYAAAPSMAFELDEFVLLGDPAARLPLLRANLTFSDAWAVPNPVFQMSPVTLTLRFKNQGPAPAEQVRLTLAIPEGWSLLGYRLLGLQGTLISTEPPIWQFEDLMPEQGGELDLTLRTAEPGWQPVTALLETATPESTLVDNRVALDIQVEEPVAYITLQCEPTTLPPGGQARVRAALQDALGQPAPDGTPVTLQASAGFFRSATVRTRGGVAEAVYVAPSRPGIVTLVASSFGTRAELFLTVRTARTPGSTGSLSRP
ncbi:MAG: C25 family cysteine peptidase [Chloroflexia bacterium]